MKNYIMGAITGGIMVALYMKCEDGSIMRMVSNFKPKMAYMMNNLK